MSRNELLSRLYGDASAKPDNFERLNPGLGNRVLPGELMTVNAATGMGAGAAMIGQQIKSINATLKDIEALYQNTFRKHGRLNVPEFYEQRRAIGCGIGCRAGWVQDLRGVFDWASE
ncbi:hypothetical protein [Marinobacter subterrani]|uniref:Uncharacterized protein n=1 Tax=Marinobacter subterrani TaxID=1658765 RepID=A0A0J7M587_9GAMM|nr:hypothetical protein [Marinobacter subterrani]KMQ76090.1 hypothetical protein Msub_12299 [Marinobacter subterrani]